MRKKVIIIGAGFSGLYAAMLLQSDYDVTIIEARDRVGGRALSVEGHDLGPSWIWPHHTLTLNLIKKFQLSTFLQYTEGDALYQNNNTIERFTLPAQMPSMRVEGAMASFTNALSKQLGKTQIILNEEAISFSLNSTQIDIRTQKTFYIADFVINTIPPRLASKLTYAPPLPTNSLELLQSTPTWMGYIIKVVITYEKAFWKEDGLSGFAFCSYPPLSEIHDASTPKEAALFGFVHAKHANISNQIAIIEQLNILFGYKATKYKKIHMLNWNKEQYTATKEDIASLSQHPQYGYNISALKDKLFFIGTESSYHEGGYIEGALASAVNIVSKII